MTKKIYNCATDDEELIFADDEPTMINSDAFSESSQADNLSHLGTSWKVIIVDDEPSVHQATKLALKNLTFENKKLTFISAYSAAEARQLVANSLDVAFIILDVVMETNSSGLELVKFIRETLNNKLVRIILRTGQPGEAPEESVIIDYDINDYKLKVELTRHKLLVAAIAALRNYRDLLEVESSRQELSVLYTALETVRNNLEDLVELRTQELEREIEERKKVEKALRLTQFSLDRARDAIYFIDADAHFFYANQAAYQILGYSKEELLQMKVGDIDPSFASLNWQEHWQQLKQQQSFTFESTHLTKDGQHLPVEITVNYLKFDKWEYNCAIARDITERKQAEDKLQKANQELQSLANLDGLTGVANRRYFDEYFATQWEQMSIAKQPLALILCDVDYFKKYNDFYGHQAGDYCLQQVAQAISNSFRKSEAILARYGGEEFVVILPNANAELATKIGTRIIQTVQQLNLPHAASEISEWVTISLGITEGIPTQEISPDFLIYRADQALYQAKQQGRNRYCLLS